MVNDRRLSFFNPQELTYNNCGRPILSAEQISSIAEQELHKYAPSCLKVPKPVPVLDILKAVGDTTAMNFQFADLGELDGHPILGEIRLADKMILRDNSLKEEGRGNLPFTAAHELGHWIIHRWKTIQLEDASAYVNSKDSHASLRYLTPRQLSTERDWIEYQANTFASNMILPQSAVKMALLEKQIRMGITRNLGRIFVGESGAKRDSQRMILLLANVFQVSASQMHIRLRQLSLIDYQNAEAEESFYA